MSFSRDTFYERLPGFVNFNEFPRVTLYTPLPPNWFVVLTDVQDSTRAIREGRYRDVNALGVASIAAVLNAVKPLKIPYVFGGDGATFCVPPSTKIAVESALVATKQMANKSFGLTLRIGMVHMSAIQRDGHQIHIGKYQPSVHYQQAIFLGDGLRYAESLVKDPDPENPFLLSEDHVEPTVNFEGFECRWNEIPSPHEEIITMLVQALERKGSSSNAIYTELLKKIIEIYGHEEYHHPLRQEQLSLASSLKKLSAEVRVQTAFQPHWKRWQYALKLKLFVIAAKWLLQNKVKTKHVDWGRFKQILITNTDYRKFDELLRMVISGTVEQRKRFRSVLEQFRQKGELVYGIHSSPNALLTCIISNYDTDHVHFLDGSDGGYSLAAREMKQQLQEL